MIKIIIVISILFVSLLCFHGCDHQKQPESNPNALDSEESVRQMAIQKFDEVNGLDRHLKYEITVKESPEEWGVYFDGKSRLPGDHMIVVKKKVTS
jgi:hypothetical protein